MLHKMLLTLQQTASNNDVDQLQTMTRRKRCC